MTRHVGPLASAAAGVLVLAGTASAQPPEDQVRLAVTIAGIDVESILVSDDAFETAIRTGAATIVDVGPPPRLPLGRAGLTAQAVSVSDALAYQGLDIVGLALNENESGGWKYAYSVENRNEGVDIEQTLSFAFFDADDTVVGEVDRSVVSGAGQGTSGIGFFDGGPDVVRVTAEAQDDAAFFFPVEDSWLRMGPSFDDVSIAEPDFADALITLNVVDESEDTQVNRPFALEFWSADDILLDVEMATATIVFGGGVDNPFELLYFGSADLSALDRVVPRLVFDRESLGLVAPQAPAVAPPPLASALSFGLLRPDSTSERSDLLVLPGPDQVYRESEPQGPLGLGPGGAIALTPSVATGVPMPSLGAPAAAPRLDATIVDASMWVADAYGAALHEYELDGLGHRTTRQFTLEDGSPSIVPISVAGRSGYDYLVVLDAAGSTNGWATRGMLIPVMLGTAPMSFGGAGGTDSRFADVAIGNDAMCLTDPVNHRIETRDLSGDLIGRFGGFGTADGQFDTPTGIHIDQDGRVYIADTGNDRVQAFRSEDGELRHLFTIPREGPFGRQLDRPTAITTSADGLIYIEHAGGTLVTDADGEVVLIGRFGAPEDADGGVTIASVAGARPADLVMADGNQLHRLDPDRHTIERFDLAQLPGPDS